MSPLTFMHLANHGARNIGNAALIFGLERVLREDLPGDIAFLPEPWDLHSRGLRRFDASFVERVNAESDALLVGAAVTFDGGDKYSNTGFRFDLPLDLWSRIEKPIVLYGLSYRAWPRRVYHHQDALRRALDVMLASDDVLLSVRNDGTREWLESIAGHRLDGIHVVPDPAVFVPTEDAPHPELDPVRPNILVAPNAEDEIERFGLAPRKRTLRRPDANRPLPFSSSWRWREARDVFLRALARALDRLAREHDANLVFCANDPFDIGMAYDLFGLLHPDTRYHVSFTGAALPTAAGPAFYDLYAKADLVLGMRIHSITPNIGLGTPVVPIVSQGRMTTFLEDAGLGDLAIDIHAADLSERTFATASQALGDPESARARLQRAREVLRQRTAEFDATVGAFVGSVRELSPT
jgi:hypothetical protein